MILRSLTVSAVVAVAASGGQAVAQAVPLTLEDLAFEPVHEVAERTILARDAQGAPLSLLLRLDAGDVVPPHGENGGTRILTVVSGELSWGDGTAMDSAAERVYGPGSVLVLPAGSRAHWAAARKGDVLVQAVFVGDGALDASVTAQIE